MMSGSGDRAIDFSGSASLETRSPQSAWNTVYAIELDNKIVQSANVLEFNLGGTMQGIGIGNAVIKDLGFVFDQPNTHFKLGFDCLIGSLRYPKSHIRTFHSMPNWPKNGQTIFIYLRPDIRKLLNLKGLPILDGGSSSVKLS